MNTRFEEPRTGAVFPQSEAVGDPGAVRAYGQAVEALGYRHLLVADHVLGVDRDAHPGWNVPYDVDTPFHEPFVLFGFLAAVTSLELTPCVIILPQRQTALVAKQAAEVDLLSEGRFRLGIGVGWNKVEYEALGLPFHDRGRRYDEQIELLRRYWTERAVTHRGAYETVTGAGIAPRPVQQPIPLWFGAQSTPAYQRIGRLADGWFPQVAPGPELEAARAIVDAAAVEAGRDPSSLGIEGRISWTGDEEAFAKAAEAWRAAGASHLGVRSAGPGVKTLDDHIAALSRAAEVLGIRSGS